MNEPIDKILIFSHYDSPIVFSKRKTMRSIILLFCLFITGLAAQTPPPAQSIGELQEQLDQLLKEFHVPGMSVAIVRKDGPEWVAGLGFANVAEEKPATANTLFRIGSTSKTFVALAVLQLVEQGKLSLDAPLRELAPEVWFENKWEEENPVRLVHLLEHTTGWDDTQLWEYALDEPTVSALKALSYDHTSRISRWPPGTRMAYNNYGPHVAAYIVEKVSGEPFEDYVKKHLFAPLSMKTATYFQPLEDAATLYRLDGVTPYPYWNLIFRPSGSCNASAEDMAACLRFFLQRGEPLLSTASLERMERPASSWGAQAGFRLGYGLCSYSKVYDGFVFQGHGGALFGGLTEMDYLPDGSAGYFYSINNAQPAAHQKIGACIRAYLTRDLPKPDLPQTGEMPSLAERYTGWYQADSPRLRLSEFLERLIALAHIRVQDGELCFSSLGNPNGRYLPVKDFQFRDITKGETPSPVSTLILLPQKPEGQFIELASVVGTITLKKIPAWLGILKITGTAFVSLSILSIFLYAPIWGIGALWKRRRRPAERSMRAWPLIAALSLIGIGAIFAAAADDLLPRLGKPTLWSFSLCSATLLFAFATLASLAALFRAPKEGVRSGVRIYSAAVTAALVIAVLYLGYWGVIGLRTWA